MNKAQTNIAIADKPFAAASDCFDRGAGIFASLRWLMLAGLMAVWLYPSSATAAPNPNCFIGMDNATTLSTATFDEVVRGAAPQAMTKTALITAKCNSNTDLPWGYYRWTLTRKALSFSAVTGGASKKVVDAVGRSFSISSNTLTVSPEGWPGQSPKYTTSTDATGGVSGLASLPAGQYLLSQAFEVQREICSWSLTWWMFIEFRCVDDGAKQNLTARYLLNVDLPLCADEWAYGNTYRVGQIVSYDSVNYKNLQWHIAYFGTYWTPPRTPALWEFRSECRAKSVEPPVQPPVSPPTTPPATGEGTGATPSRSVKPNPWTVRGYAAKRRCEVCDQMRGWE